MSVDVPAKQKFHEFDLVRIADNLGSCMSHFRSGCDAIVIGSYADQYGGNNHTSYTLYIRGHDESSWYYEEQLTLIRPGAKALLEEWKTELEIENKQKGDLEWIFSHGAEILVSCSGATVASLALCMGIDDLWGSRGEGIDYYSNARYVLRAAEPFLKSGDLTGWRSFCANKERE